jgi:hypothetical protein
MRPAALLLSVLLVATAAPRLEAQLLDGQWFKMTVSFDGSGVNPETSEAEAGKLKKVVNYVQFNLGALDGGAPSYDLVVESLTTDDTWVDSGFTGSVQMLDTQETYVQTAQIGMPTKPLVLADGAPNIAQVTFNGPVKSKLKNAELKSAKITALGATSYFTNDNFAFYGKAKVTLTRVDVADLPFVLVLDATKPAPEPKAPPVAAKPAAPCTDGGAATEPSGG